MIDQDIVRLCVERERERERMKSFASKYNRINVIRQIQAEDQDKKL